MGAPPGAEVLDLDAPRGDAARTARRPPSPLVRALVVTTAVLVALAAAVVAMTPEHHGPPDERLEAQGFVRLADVDGTTVWLGRDGPSSLAVTTTGVTGSACSATTRNWLGLVLCAPRAAHEADVVLAAVPGGTKVAAVDLGDDVVPLRLVDHPDGLPLGAGLRWGVAVVTLDEAPAGARLLVDGAPFDRALTPRSYGLVG